MASSYWSFLYRIDGENKYTELGGNGWRGLNYDYSDEIAAGYRYAVRIRVISDNINQYANSGYSDYILFDHDAVNDNVNNKLDEVINDEITTDNVAEAVDSVKNAFQSEDDKKQLQIAMQSDTATQDKIKNLEDAYKEAKGLKVSATSDEDTGINPSSISLLEAALNATESGSVSFNMKKPDEETQKKIITETRYDKAIILDLGLEAQVLREDSSLLFRSLSLWQHHRALI